MARGSSTSGLGSGSRLGVREKLCQCATSAIAKMFLALRIRIASAVISVYRSLFGIDTAKLLCTSVPAGKTRRGDLLRLGVRDIAVSDLRNLGLGKLTVVNVVLIIQPQCLRKKEKAYAFPQCYAALLLHAACKIISYTDNIPKT